MEFIIALVVLGLVAWWYFKKPAAIVESAPYKVETPVEEKKPTVKKATTRKPKVEGEKTPAVKAKTARKPKAE